MIDNNHSIALAIEKLVKRYGSFTAVDGICLQIRAGQVYGILGPNGAGKSTAIKMIAGLLQPDSGTVKIFGKDPAMGTSITDIGLCPQELVVWEGLTVVEQLVFMAGMYDIPASSARKRAEELLASMYLTDKRNKLASTLSGGMKRRLSILLALIHDPKIVILDEPQAGLDPQSRVLVRDYIKNMAGARTVIVTTHDMEEADKITDRVAIMDRGCILVEDTPENIKKKAFRGELLEISLSNVKKLDVNTESRLKGKYGSISVEGNMIRLATESSFDDAKEMEKLLGSSGIKIEGIKIRKGTLEDVFIALTGRGLRE